MEYEAYERFAIMAEQKDISEIEALKYIQEKIRQRDCCGNLEKVQ